MKFRMATAVCKAADLQDCRLHDLRHTFCSILASDGASLLIIGSLLGHTQKQTTARYAHLLDTSLRVATEPVGACFGQPPHGNSDLDGKTAGSGLLPAE
jgi:site-specific recombinase XerD